MNWPEAISTQSAGPQAAVGGVSVAVVGVALATCSAYRTTKTTATTKTIKSATKRSFSFRELFLLKGKLSTPLSGSIWKASPASIFLRYFAEDMSWQCAYTQSCTYRRVYYSDSIVTTTPSSGVAVPGADEILTFICLVSLSHYRMTGKKSRDYENIYKIQPIRPYKLEIWNTGFPVTWMIQRTKFPVKIRGNDVKCNANFEPNKRVEFVSLWLFVDLSCGQKFRD